MMTPAEWVDQILKPPETSPPYRQGDPWWLRPECHVLSHCAKGFDFHAMGTVKHGRHTLKKSVEKAA